MRPQEEREEYGTGEQVQDSVPDDLTSWANDVTTIGERPNNEVDRPDAGQEESSAKEGAVCTASGRWELITTGVEDEMGTAKIDEA